MQNRHSPIRRGRQWARWFVTVAFALVVVALVCSRWVNATCIRQGFPYGIELIGGELVLYVNNWPRSDWRVIGLVQGHVTFAEYPFISWWPEIEWTSEFKTIIIPLWIPSVLLGALTLVLWRRTRRFPPGQCRRCGYNLTGNVSGVCPECGQRVDSAKPIERGAPPSAA